MGRKDRKYDRLPLGHAYGAGRETTVQKDKRTRRKRTRQAQRADALRE